MSDFEERWRTLARSARSAPERPLVPLRSEWATFALARKRGGAEPSKKTFVGWGPDWALPAAAVALLYALALPVVEPAWNSMRMLRNPLAAVPRAPRVPTPPVPAPPALPRPPGAGESTELLQKLMKEMQP
jgi:hypothetical protein